MYKINYENLFMYCKAIYNVTEEMNYKNVYLIIKNKSYNEFY